MAGYFQPWTDSDVARVQHFFCKSAKHQQPGNLADGAKMNRSAANP
jgi:hypothetical protein